MTQPRFLGFTGFAKPNHNFNRLWSLRSKSSFSSISRQNGRNGLNISFLLEEKYIFQIVISLENSSNCIIHKLKSAKPSHFDEIFSNSNFTWKNRHLPWIFLAYWDFFLFADPDFFLEFKIFVFPEFFIEFVFFADPDFFEFEIFPDFFFYQIGNFLRIRIIWKLKIFFLRIRIF